MTPDVLRKQLGVDLAGGHTDEVKQALVNAWVAYFSDLEDDRARLRVRSSFSEQELRLLQRALENYDNDFSVDAGSYATRPEHVEEQRAVQALLQRIQARGPL
jgi:hypothetical protein